MQVVFHMAWSGSPEELLINLFKVFDVNGWVNPYANFCLTLV